MEQDDNRARKIAEVDAALLTDDLPPVGLCRSRLPAIPENRADPDPPTLQTQRLHAPSSSPYTPPTDCQHSCWRCVAGRCWPHQRGWWMRPMPVLRPVPLCLPGSERRKIWRDPPKPEVGPPSGATLTLEQKTALHPLAERWSHAQRVAKSATGWPWRKTSCLTAPEEQAKLLEPHDRMGQSEPPAAHAGAPELCRTRKIPPDDKARQVGGLPGAPAEEKRPARRRPAQAQGSVARRRRQAGAAAKTGPVPAQEAPPAHSDQKS
jgi:hypothetical protein